MVKILIISPSVNATCAAHEFQCGRQCLPMKWRCDGNEDCHPNGEDEKNCDTLPTKPTCAADKWQCASGDCIADIWRCDGEIDCIDRSDEENCSKVLTSILKCKKFQTKKSFCLQISCVELNQIL